MSQDRRVSRWASALLLLPLPAHFAVSVISDPGPAWRAEYRPILEPAAAPAVVMERELSHVWDRRASTVPGGNAARGSSARFDACLELEAAREIPFMLVANGLARFELDGDEKLRVEAPKARRASGAVLRLEPGVHHLRVDFVARGWPSIALNASLDGRAPVPLGSGELAEGVELSPPLAGDRPCARGSR